jgi:probable HAF family extracellular repeat protein
MRRLALVGAAGLLLSSTGPRPVSAQPAPPKYTITDLGHLGGDEARATAISARGQIVGVSYLPGRTVRHAFLYENGALTDLCTSLPSGTSCVASDVNASGQVAGSADLPVGGQTPVVYENGGVVTLTEPDWYAGIAGGINGRGQVVGWARRSSLGGNYHGYLFDGAPPRTDLGTLGGWSIATDVNHAGDVVGYSVTTDGSMLGFLWRNGVLTPLATLGGASSGANEINSSGDIAGWSSTPSGESRPVLYRGSDGAVVDLGSLGGTEGSAFAMNDLGHVVGYSYAAGGERHAFLHDGTAIEDLNRLIPAGSGWELVAATGINDAGRIVGYGCAGSPAVPPQGCASGYLHAFVLTPSGPQMLANLIALIQGFGLPGGLETSLTRKLENAQKSLDKGNTRAACNQISAFVNGVAAQGGHGLTADQADQLLGGAAEVRAGLGCP